MAKHASQQDTLISALKAEFGAAILGEDRSYGDLTVTVEKSRVHDILAFMKNHQGFNQLLDIFGVDCLKLEGRPERFEIEYLVYRMTENFRVRVLVAVPDDDLELPTITDLWESANWGEREVYEFFGFNFIGHPNLQRLLTHHEFQGFPLRKDYPIMQGQWCSSSSDLDDQLQE